MTRLNGSCDIDHDIVILTPQKEKQETYNRKTTNHKETIKLANLEKV
jgi:hypothetical protein